MTTKVTVAVNGAYQTKAVSKTAAGVEAVAVVRSGETEEFDLPEGGTITVGPESTDAEPKQ